MLSRERFLRACRCEATDRPPFWIMRQAGRYLPEYQELKSKYSFVEMVHDPELACEVTMQPMRRYPLDAAILFSDILVIPEALGQPYHFLSKGGVEMAFKLNSPTKINQLNPDRAPEALSYVTEAMQLVRKELNGEKALLGFGGSPWTLATYMVEGGSSAKTHDSIKNMAYGYPQLFEALMEKLTQALISYLRQLIEAGADAIQIFDSHAALCADETYWKFSLQWIHYIALALEDTGVPIILYTKGMGHRIEELMRTGVHVHSVDWTVNLEHVHNCLAGRAAVQGNLDPSLLCTSPEITQKHVQHILNKMQHKPGYIFNLGHGITPNAKTQCMEALAYAVTNASNPNVAP